MRLFLWVIVLILITGFIHGDTIENEFLRFTLDRNSGAYVLKAKEPGLPDCTGGLDGMATAPAAESKPDTIACTARECAYVFALEAETPFLLVSVSRAPGAPEPSTGNLKTPAVQVRFDAALNGVRALGCDGLTDAAVARTSYTFLALAGAEGHGGVVAGWLTQNRASGIVLSETIEGKAALYGRAEYGLPRHLPGPDDPVELFAVGLFADPLDGLEAYGAVLARTNGIVLDKPVPSGYCTWYSDPHGGASDQKHLAELADFCAANLAPYGFDVIQIESQGALSKRHEIGGEPYPDAGHDTGSLVHSLRGRPGK